MSAVLTRAKRQYFYAIKWKFGIVLLLSCFIAGIKSQLFLSFLSGALSGLLPHCLFVYWVFFKPVKNQKKLTAFYRGEGLKWLITIMLIVASLTLIPDLQFLVFFAGYFLTLFLNIILPIMLNKKVV